MITDQLKPTNHAVLEDRLPVSVYGLPGRPALFKLNMFTVWKRSWGGPTLPAFEQIVWTETVGHADDHVTFRGEVNW